MITLFNIVSAESLETDIFDVARAKVKEWEKKGFHRADILTDGVNRAELFKNMWIKLGNSNDSNFIHVSLTKESRSYKEFEALLNDGRKVKVYLFMKLSVLRQYKNYEDAILKATDHLFSEGCKQIFLTDYIHEKIINAINKIKV